MATLHTLALWPPSGPSPGIRTGHRDRQTHIVPDVDVGPLGEQQLHKVHMLILSGPNHGRPATIILIPKERRPSQQQQTGTEDTLTRDLTVALRGSRSESPHGGWGNQGRVQNRQRWGAGWPAFSLKEPLG